LRPGNKLIWGMHLTPGHARYGRLG